MRASRGNRRKACPVEAAIWEMRSRLSRIEEPVGHWEFKLNDTDRPFTELNRFRLAQRQVIARSKVEPIWPRRADSDAGSGHARSLPRPRRTGKPRAGSTAVRLLRTLTPPR